MSIFNELKDSLTEAVQIKKGQKTANRVIRYEVTDVKALRENMAITQAQLAHALSTSVDTIKSWESKRRNPTGLAAKVLATIQDNPEFYHQLAAH
ncbi:MAG: NadS family protein [Pseudomonadota bacterium]